MEEMVGGDLRLEERAIEEQAVLRAGTEGKEGAQGVGPSGRRVVVELGFAAGLAVQTDLPRDASQCFRPMVPGTTMVDHSRSLRGNLLDRAAHVLLRSLDQRNHKATCPHPPPWRSSEPAQLYMGCTHMCRNRHLRSPSTPDATAGGPTGTQTQGYPSQHPPRGLAPPR